MIPAPAPVRTVFLCPPASAHQILEPEPQFSKSFTRMVSKESHLSYEDVAKGMRLVPRKANNRARWTPPFATDDALLQRVLIARAGEYILEQTGVRLAKDCDWQCARFWCLVALRCQLRRAMRAGNGAEYRHNELAQVAALKKAGCFLSYQAATAFLSWRLNYHCVDAARELGVMPATFRQSLNRLVRTARRLGLPTFQPHPSNKGGGKLLTPEQKSAAYVESSKRQMADPVIKAKVLKGQRVANATPETKEARSAGQRTRRHTERLARKTPTRRDRRLLKRIEHQKLQNPADPTLMRVCGCGVMLRPCEAECGKALELKQVYRVDERLGSA